MRKAVGVLLVAAALAGASLASADTVSFTRNLAGFPNNFNTGIPAKGLNWGLLGANTSIASGSSFTELSETVTVNFSAGSGFTYVQCPTATCTWNGEFGPGQILLSTSNEGSMTINFSKSVSGVGFQAMPGFESPVPNDEYIEIGVYDGATLLATFFSGIFGGPAGSDDNSANFFGVSDLTGADITSIKLAAFTCVGRANCSPNVLAINHTLLNVPTTPVVPEPASLALLGSGLGLLSFLRRKRAASK
jgi:hypothetical protein